jgi:hypothetical protein
MIGKVIGMLMGRKLKEKAIDAVLDRVDLPDPVEASIKAATTGNVGDLVGDLTKKRKPKK